jgi:hypothetical protein
MTTQDMVKKRQRSLDSTGSSSSGEMGPSKPPKDVLGLGRHLVRELGFEDGVDTLGRWMAHHLTELIDAAENGATAAERLRARKSAMETILKIWEHRTSLPGKAYPLAPYKDVLQVLDRLRPDDNPFRYFSHYAKRTREQLAADLFDGLSRLTIALLLMKLPPGEESAKVDDAAIEALSETEQHMLEAFQQWGEFFAPESRSSGRARKSKHDGGVTKVNLEEAALQLIDATMTTLSELRSELQGVGRQPAE